MSGDKTIAQGASVIGASTSPEFDAPQNEWLKIDKAIFSFAPNYLSNMDERRRALRSEAAEFFSEHSIKVKFSPYGGDDIELNFFDIVFSIQDTNDFFVMDIDCNYEEYLERDFLDDKPAKFNASGAGIEAFRDDLLNTPINSRFSRAASVAAQLATRLMRMYNQGFEEAVKSGCAVIYARARSPLNPFKRVHPDQWRHFRIIDQEAGTAEGPTGELLFSVHVLPQEVSPQRAELAAVLNGGAGNPSRAAAIKQCTSWLITVIQGSPENRTHSNEELWEQAQSRWPQRLSRRGFEEAYRAARAIADAPAWGKTGPRKRARN